VLVIPALKGRAKVTRRSATKSNHHTITPLPPFFISGLLSCIAGKVETARRAPMRRACSLKELGVLFCAVVPRTLGRLNPDSLKSTSEQGP
jgi:hypothetical protein